MPQTQFSLLTLQAPLLQNLASLGYAKMTPIQAQSLPPILEGKDLIAQAKTGSGKTAAFGLGLLEKLDPSLFRAQAVVLCPTRELADQVAKEIRRLARAIPNIKVLCLSGGKPLSTQAKSISFGVHVVVGTPGRIEDHLGKGTLPLQEVNLLVLDEADRMLDMGFGEAIDTIVDQMPASNARQTLLFSATYPKHIQAVAKRVMKSPVMVKVDASHDDGTIAQHFYLVKDEAQRKLALRLLLMHFRPESALVFCNTKIETQAVAEQLAADGFSALALHGDLEQKDRDETLLRFANKSTAILLATDVAARGLDIDALDVVINYQIANDPEVHVHRIGRTGRAGSKGVACALYSEQEFHRVVLLPGNIDPVRDGEALPPMPLLEEAPITAQMRTIQIDSGRKQKIRPGDVLGALTNNKVVLGKQVGKIHILEHSAYVAVDENVASQAVDTLNKGKLKGRRCRARLII